MRDSQTTSAAAVLGRITWMMLGPMALAVAAFLVLSKGGGWLTSADLAYFIALAATLFGRWLEAKGGTPQKATGEPATTTDQRNYVLGATIGGLVVWGIANLLGNYWFTS